MTTNSRPVDAGLLEGRTALVTGAFSGLGLHFARVLAAHGARVALAGRRIDLGRSVADALTRIDGEIGVPAIVVNNAGTVARAPSLELDEDAWRGVIDVNLSGVFRVAQASARAMVKAGSRGSIVNIASILGLRVRTQVAAYAASKAAVVQLTHALALEWAEHGIRVNAIAPGYFETDINRDLLRSPAGQAIVARIPQQRVGQLAELDGPLLLLASDASSYMSGVVIPVDGGHLVNTL
jgi:NAD(P)-dependent dehydrogenase (short-subunit alcohol dehydrogenase family)